MSILSIDFETRSTVDLGETGVYPYAKHPTTDIWCMAWAFDDEEPEIWTPSKRFMFEGLPGLEDNPLPDRILDHIAAGGEVRAWNMAFERTIWREIMVRRYGAPALAPAQCVCTMAEAAAMSLPLSLEKCAEVLRIEERKDMGGADLMKRMARPRKILPDGTPVWWDVPEKIQSLHTYCQQDVRVERAVAKCLLRLTPAERAVYLLDQRINDRGVRVDVELVRAAQAIVEEGMTRADAELSDLTDGAIPGAMNWNAIRLWVNSQGIATDSVDRPTRAELLAREDLPPLVRRVLRLVDDAGQTSVAKLPTLLNYADPDDQRARGMLQYHAAGTGRWGGRGPQPQNFKRPELEGNPEQYIPVVLGGRYDTVDLAAPAITVVTDLLRSMLTAAPGMELIAADYASIEAVVLNWLADETEVLESFRRYLFAPTKEEKKRHDPYRKMAAAFGSDDRQAGKAAELGSGFQMGWEKFISAAWDIYQVRVTPEQARLAVEAYRATHPKVKQFWYDANDAAIEAVKNPGTVVRFGGLKNLKMTKRGAWLFLILPSGRPLAYARPRVVQGAMPWCDVCGKKRTRHEDADHDFTPARKEQVEVEGMLPMGKQWGTIRLYGGLIVENVVQAVARDLIAEGMLRAEAAGYTPILSVHDEAVAEVPAGFGDVKEFERILATTPEWASGLPVAAEGWRGFRFRK